MSEKKHHLIILALSLFIVFASLYLPKTFNDYNELQNIKCGWPLFFIEGHSNYDPPLPWQSSCTGSFGGTAMDQGALRDFLWLPFFLNVALVFSLLTLAFHAMQLINQKRIK